MISARHLGLEVVKVSAGEELIKCPFHSDNKPSAWFNPAKGLFWCAVCHVGLSAESLVKQMGLDLDLDGLLAEHEDEIPDFDLIEMPVDLPYGIQTYSLYTKGRGVNENVSRMYGLESDTTNHAIIFPVNDKWNNRVGTVQRFTDPEEHGMRYKKMGKMTPIWPLPFLAGFKQGDYILVTEGVWSALRISTFSQEYGGRGYTFTTFGARANQEIVDVLSPFSPVFLYDNDKAGRNACRKMRELAPQWNSFTLPKAPDDMNFEEMKELIWKLRASVFKGDL